MRPIPLRVFALALVSVCFGAVIAPWWPAAGGAPVTAWENRPLAPPSAGAAASGTERIGLAAAAGVLAGFVPNRGQWPAAVRFAATLGPMSAIVDSHGWWLDLTRGPAPAREGRRGSEERACGAALQMTFVGSAPADISGEEVLSGVHHYLLDPDPVRWRTGVPRFAAVRLRGLYPGVDVRLYQVAGHFEYDVHVAQDAELERVEIRVDGAHGLELDDDGALLVHTAVGTVRQPRPIAYTSDAAGVRTAAACGFLLTGREAYRFVVPGGQRQGELCIDPGMLYSTFAGGSSGAHGFAMSVSDAGIVTVAGHSESVDFPTTPGAWSRAPRNLDGLVFSLDPERPPAEQLRYATFLGGASTDYITGMVVGGDGAISVCGVTYSEDFPTTLGAFDATFNGGGWPCNGGDVFVARLDPARSGAQQLVYGTYLGGSSCERPTALAVDTSHAIAVTGWTESRDFPTSAGAAARAYRGGASDIFVARLDPLASSSQQLTYSSYVGGLDEDWSWTTVADQQDRIILAGYTLSPDYPTTGDAWRRTPSGGDINLTIIDPTRSGLASIVYSTLFGGSGTEVAVGLHEAAGIVTLTGAAQSFDFPVTPDAFVLVQSDDVFVSRLDVRLPPAQQLLYSTRFGGQYRDTGRGVAVDSKGVITVAGDAGVYGQPGFPSGFPTTPGAMMRIEAGGPGDGFVARLDPSLRGADQLIYSTFLGGWSSDTVASVAIDDRGVAFVMGATSSPNFPATANAWDRTYNGGPYDDVFISLLDMLPGGVHLVGASGPGCDGRLAMGVTSWPVTGNDRFALTCSRAPPSSFGQVLIGVDVRASPLRVAGIDFWVDALVTCPAASDVSGGSHVRVPVPSNPGLIACWFGVQFLWVGPSGPPPCPPSGLSSSNALRIQIQR